MRHKKIREQLMLSLYGELDWDRQRRLDEHLKQCADCRAELQDLKDLHEWADNLAPRPSDSLLREARAQLRGALSARRGPASVGSPWGRFFSGHWSVGAAAATGLACLALGFLGGRFFFAAPTASPPIAAVDQLLHDPEVTVSNVRFLSGGPEGEMEIALDAVRPLRLTGRVDDPVIRKVLSETLLNSVNPGMRMRAVGLIGEQRKTVDEDVKKALIQAAKRDENSGVRRRALGVLSEMTVDREVKETLIHVLLHDENPGLRVAAIAALEASAVEGAVDPTLLRLVEERTATEPNDYVRQRTKAYLQEVRFQ